MIEIGDQQDYEKEFCRDWKKNKRHTGAIVGNDTTIVRLEMQAWRLERRLAFLPYIDCTRLLDGIDKDSGYVCLRRSTAVELDYSMREDNNREFLFGDWFGLEPLTAIRDVVHVIQKNYRVKPFYNAFAGHYYCSYFNRFYRNEKVLEHRRGSETVEYNR